MVPAMNKVMFMLVVAGLCTAAVACGSSPKPDDPTTVYGASSGSAAEGTSGAASLPSGTPEALPPGSPTPSK